MRQIVLMYHDVYCRNKSESGFQNPRNYVYMISDQTFESHLRMITEWRRSKRIPPQKILFSFDDGGGSGFTTIAPLLEKYDYKGIFFIATKYIGEQGFLTRSQIKELYDRGHLIGSHSHSHPVRLTSLSREEIDCEWEKSQRVLESILGFRPSVASIPNGYVSPYVLTSLAKVGIMSGFYIGAHHAYGATRWGASLRKICDQGRRFSPKGEEDRFISRRAVAFADQIDSIGIGEVHFRRFVH